MAQASKAKSSKSSNSSNSRSGTRRKASGSSRSTGAKRASSSRSSSNGSRAKKGANASRSRPRAQSRSAQNRNGASSITDTAIDKATTSGRAVADAASKAKTPLIAGGTALAGAAVGVVIKSRLGAGNGKKGPLKRLGASKPMANLAKPMAKLDLGKLDLDAVKSLATQMKAYSQQASDIADAVEKTRKKN